MIYKRIKNYNKKDISFMNKALREASKAFKSQEVPVGAVLVDPDGKVLSKGYNQVEKKHSQLAHAEIIAIKKACKKRGDWRLEGCVLYVTLEPCKMCMGLIILSRISKVFFGAKSSRFGYQLDKDSTISVYKKNVVKVIEGLCSEEASDLLKVFFRNRRKQRKDSKGEL